MPSDFNFDKPSYEEYTEWYEYRFHDNLASGNADRWHQMVTNDGKSQLESSDFWRRLQEHLPDWNAAFQAEHGGYPLFAVGQQPDSIGTKTFVSALNKCFRWNVLQNDRWPNPPERSPSTVSDHEDIDQYDPQRWYGPNNWLVDFPDIFRTRFTTIYFDGVTFLADRIKEVAEQTTNTTPILRFRASLEGYHAAHIWVYHKLDTMAYGTRDDVSLYIRLELQVTTHIQASISDMLHGIYEDWRLTGSPRDWEWDHESSAFSVNYLGSTLHYLEGMIVTARDKQGRE